MVDFWTSLKDPSENYPTQQGATMNYRPLATIAREISNDWKQPYFGAVPYLGAMRALISINDEFGADSAKSIVLYFLANAQTWKGPVARRIKAELKAMAAGKPLPRPFVQPMPTEERV